MPSTSTPDLLPFSLSRSSISYILVHLLYIWSFFFCFLPHCVYADICVFMYIIYTIDGLEHYSGHGRLNFNRTTVMKTRRTTTSPTHWNATPVLRWESLFSTQPAVTGPTSRSGKLLPVLHWYQSKIGRLENQLVGTVPPPFPLLPTGSRLREYLAVCWILVASECRGGTELSYWHEEWHWLLILYSFTLCPWVAVARPACTWTVAWP